jgi:hypothetical protein
MCDSRGKLLQVCGGLSQAVVFGLQFQNLFAVYSLGDDGNGTL